MLITKFVNQSIFWLENEKFKSYTGFATRNGKIVNLDWIGQITQTTEQIYLDLASTTVGHGLFKGHQDAVYKLSRLESWFKIFFTK